MPDQDTIIVRPEADLKCVEALWFEDGSLVLQAEKSLFRVYAGILSARSSVFRDMLSFPQPKDQELIDGCQLVQLSDSGVDVTFFLRAIYDSSFFEPAPAQTEFSTVAAVLRLSTRYDVHYLRRRALLHLGTVYPTQLTDWDKRDSLRTFSAAGYIDFAVVELVREVEAFWILPSAMYRCCAHPIREILDGVPCNESSLGLNEADMRTCVIATHLLARVQHNQINGFFRRYKVEGCFNPKSCAPSRLSWLDGSIENDPIDPLCIWNGRNKESLGDNLCRGCFQSFTTQQGLARSDLWADLPRIFDLPTWKELDISRGDALQA